MRRWQLLKHAERKASVAFELVPSTSARPSRVADELAWCRSVAGRLPRSMAEGVGRFSCAVRRALQLGGLHGHGTNCHRHRGALHGWMWFL